MSETKFAPILPYEEGLQDNFQIYKAVKYTRDVDLTQDVELSRHSPNMIKYYTTLEQEPKKIGGD